jgi:dipeptidyl aminopeptidase/acylaminoacyl peptidase
MKREICAVKQSSGPTILRSLLYLAMLAVAAPSCAQLTPEQALDRKQLSDVHYSPDGARVAFTVAEPMHGTTPQSNVWVLDSRSREVHRFTTSEKTDRSPRWSPDGKTLAFLSNRAERMQIYLLPAKGGEARAVTKGKNSIGDFSWSPDGKQIAFLAEEPPTEEEERKEKDKDDERVMDVSDKLRRLWILDVESGGVRQITKGGWEIREFEWAPDVRTFYAIATDKPPADQWLDCIVTISGIDGTIREIFAPRGPLGDMHLSRDGSMLAFVGSCVDGPAPHDLFVLPVAGRTARNLTAARLDRPIFEYKWLADGSLMAVAETGFTTRLYHVTMDGQAAPVPEFPVHPSSFDAGPSGDIAFVGETTTEAPELWIATHGSSAEKVSDFHAQWKSIALSKPEFLHYKSFDGVEIEGALLKPLDYKEGTRVPLIVDVHGGPTGAWRDGFDRWGQLLATRGYAVLYPNVRGSSGYGEKFVEMNRADWGGGDFKDLMAGVDYLIARGVADPERLGIGGWSYGGYMAAWAITQTTRFKASIVGAGLSDLAAEYGTEQGPEYDEWFFGLPYENLQKFLADSPIRYIKNARTPTLILHGKEDPLDPIGQGQQLYRALKRYGVPAEFVVYPRELHPVREEKHTLDLLRRVIAWYDKYVKGA